MDGGPSFVGMDYIHVIPIDLLTPILQLTNPTIDSIRLLAHVNKRFQTAIRNGVKLDGGTVEIRTDHCINHIRSLNSIGAKFRKLSIWDWGQFCKCSGNSGTAVSRELFRLIASSRVREIFVELRGKSNEIVDYMSVAPERFQMKSVEHISIRTIYQSNPRYVNLSWIAGPPLEQLSLKNCLPLPQQQQHSAAPIKVRRLMLTDVTLDKQQLSDAIDLESVASVILDANLDNNVPTVFPNISEFNLMIICGHRTFRLSHIQSIITSCDKLRHVNVCGTHLILDKEYKHKSPLHELIRPLSFISSSSSSPRFIWILRYGECDIRIYHCRTSEEEFEAFTVDFVQSSPYNSLRALLEDYKRPDLIAIKCNITLAQATKLTSLY